MTQLNYKVVGPVVTEKEFVRNKNGNYVLSYNVSPAKINKGRNDRIMSLSQLVKQQSLHSQSKVVNMKNKTQLLEILNAKSCH